MVLFLEPETLRLLDLYAALRAEPGNVTNNGVLLKQHARESLTASLNKSFPREQPWTESQVTVKFKNLRSEYAEFKWLSAQPGFQADGDGLTEDWWQNAKRVRPKCHAFKGKLPWAFEARMKEIVGDGGPEYSKQWPTKKNEKQKEQPQQPSEEEDGEERQEQEQVADEEPESSTAVTNTLPVDELATTATPRHKRKRDESVESEGSSQSRREGQDRGTPIAVDDASGDNSYGRSLARSVEQSAMASAGMARGFQDLIGIFQEQTAKCRVLEQQLTQRSTETPSLVLAEQRSVLLSIARSLEQSTRATADLAQGYRELVKAFVRESDATRQQR
ncbi:hypothetical protein V7S43_017219 [Phytophthora oleae]|uniref:Myb/SANT-like domain-containing protein n=1 Tax=Phytophthora oleae TaxID=2107226 RepID=A0ABD3EUI9_9STRA